MTDVENFVEAAGGPTLTHAAKRLAISQPALSESIKRLEVDLELVLFYRSRSGIRLTPSGTAILSKAQRAMQSLREIELAEDALAPFAGRTITIGCHPIVAQYSLPKALGYLHQSAPDYRVNLRHDLSRSIQFDVQRGSVDIGIVVNPTPVPDVVIRKIGSDHFCVWAKRQRDLDTVICDPLLVQTQAILKKWKRPPERIITTDSIELIAQLADHGIGYGILPQRAVVMLKAKLERMASLPMHRDEIALVYRPEFGKIAAERLVIEALKRALTVPISGDKLGK